MEAPTRTAAVRARCTAVEPPMEDMAGGKMEGPDADWVLLKDAPDEVGSFCKGDGAQLQHRGRQHYTHVCAYHGAWAFDAGDGSHVRCVVFMHYRIPKGATKLLGEVDSGSGAKLFNVSGADLLARYSELKKKGHHVHVWQREKQGEIAIDFCIGHGEPQKKATAPKAMFSKFLSRFK